jgi:hypothetical protein
VELSTKRVTPAVPKGRGIERAIHRLRMVFLEIPGIQLSLAEAARVTELETHICQILLSALEDLRFLRRAADGGYQRQSSE